METTTPKRGLNKRSRKQAQPGNDEAKIILDKPIYIDKAPENGANKPDMTISDKKNKVIILVNRTDQR